MADISQVKLPNGDVFDLVDLTITRLTEVDIDEVTDGVSTVYNGEVS